MVVDAMRAAGRRNDVHGLVEFDVTDARRRFEAELEATGMRRSFTASLVHCLARAVADHPGVQAYRDWRGRVVHFDDVDVMVVVETTVDDAPAARFVERLRELVEGGYGLDRGVEG